MKEEEKTIHAAVITSLTQKDLFDQTDKTKIE